MGLAALDSALLAAPNPVERVDISRIAQLNRADDDDDDEVAAPPAPVDPTLCCGCRAPLKGGGKYFRYDDQRWHLRCFACTRCRTPLAPDDFYQDHLGRPECEACHDHKAIG